MEDETLSKIIVSIFSQESYRRSTAVKTKNGNKLDVDVIGVTKLDSEEYTSEETLNLFVLFLDKHYKDKYRMQGRSIGINLSYVDLYIVPTSAPSESETGILQDDAMVAFNEYAFQNNVFAKQFNKRKASIDRWMTISVVSSACHISICQICKDNQIVVEEVYF